MMPDKSWFHSGPVSLLPSGMFFDPDLLSLYSYWESQQIFTGQLSSSFSSHSCLCISITVGMSRLNFPLVEISGSSSSRLMGMIAYRSLPLLFCAQTSPVSPMIWPFFLSKAISVLFPPPVFHNLTPLLLVIMYSSILLPSPCLSLLKRQNILKCGSGLPKPDLYG